MVITGNDISWGTRRLESWQQIFLFWFFPVYFAALILSLKMPEMLKIRKFEKYSGGVLRKKQTNQIGAIILKMNNYLALERKTYLIVFSRIWFRNLSGKSILTSKFIHLESFGARICNKVLIAGAKLKIIQPQSQIDSHLVRKDKLWNWDQGKVKFCTTNKTIDLILFDLNHKYQWDAIRWDTNLFKSQYLGLNSA